MSRCFPFPPPGFVVIGNKASDEALIDSIKKVEKANKEQRKEKRKEKKEMSKEKKEKKRLKKENKDTIKTKPTDTDHEAHKDAKILAEFGGENSHKRKHEEIEQLEGSSVTEEHGQPLNLQNPSYSSDSTQNCNKRRKQVSFANDGCGHGKIIRIKLPLQKHKESGSTVSEKQLSSTSGVNVLDKEPDVSTSEEQCCSTSGRSEIHKLQNCSGSGCTFLDYSGQDTKTSQVDADMTLLRTDISSHGLSSGPSNEMSSPVSANAEVLAQVHRQIIYDSVPGSCSTSLDKKMLKINSQYTNLIQNLYHMAMPQLVDNDEEWLFGGKTSEKLLKKTIVEKQFVDSSGVTCSGSSMQYPCARYLQEAKIFALPYTIPF
ncbi:hypothetical protein POM88_016731 [Heracleum sosnowskyi]|uniref:Uncharacterized protein n=1 Tax=Heracleum sosnowskyi TaxID=360622 RepID=A0AAD8INY6_9APIA|nr:hypothetical protein POM88_016731 [Heracleum sosnowskyi]